jgi:hypothetical protein
MGAPHTDVSEHLSAPVKANLEFFSMRKQARQLQEFRLQSVSRLLSRVADEYLAFHSRPKKTRHA